MKKHSLFDLFEIIMHKRNMDDFDIASHYSIDAKGVNKFLGMDPDYIALANWLQKYIPYVSDKMFLTFLQTFIPKRDKKYWLMKRFKKQAIPDEVWKEVKVIAEECNVSYGVAIEYYNLLTKRG